MLIKLKVLGNIYHLKVRYNVATLSGSKIKHLLSFLRGTSVGIYNKWIQTRMSWLLSHSIYYVIESAISFVIKKIYRSHSSQSIPSRPNENSQVYPLTKKIYIYSAKLIESWITQSESPKFFVRSPKKKSTLPRYIN